MTKIETLQESIRASMAADDLPITKLKLKNGSPMVRESRRAQWFRIVRATNRERRPGAWQFVGDYAKNEIEEPPGTVVLGKSTKGDYHLMIVMPGVGLRTLTIAPSATIEMRRQAQIIINDPATAIEAEITRAMHDAEEAQELLERTAQPAKKTPKKTAGKNHWTERDTQEREWRRRIQEFDSMMDALPTEAPPEKHELRAEHRRLRLRLKHLEAELADS